MAILIAEKMLRITETLSQKSIEGVSYGRYGLSLPLIISPGEV